MLFLIKHARNIINSPERLLPCEDDEERDREIEIRSCELVLGPRCESFKPNSSFFKNKRRFTVFCRECPPADPSFFIQNIAFKLIELVNAVILSKTVLFR